MESSRDSPGPRIKVVYLDHCARLSGGELALLRLLPALGSVSPHVILAEDGPLVQRFQEIDIPVEVMTMRESARGMTRHGIRPTPRSLLAASSVVGYVLRLRRRLAELRPDIIHTNSLKSAVYGSIAGRLVGVPVVCHIRDRLATDYMPAPAVAMMRRLLRNLPAAVIANSESTLATLGPLQLRASVVPSPVIYDPVQPQPAREARTGHPFTVGMLGRLSPWKGQDVFIEAFARAFPDGEARARIIGSSLFGEDDYEARLRALVSARGLDGRVQFTGFIDDVRGELAGLDVLVHASIIPEPFGQVVAEGMAAGLPVVASDAGGPAEVIDHRVNGFLYQTSDSVALARLLVELESDPELRLAVGSRARDAAQRFSPELIGAAVEAIYAEVLKSRR